MARVHGSLETRNLLGWPDTEKRKHSPASLRRTWCGGPEGGPVPGAVSLCKRDLQIGHRQT